MTSKAGKKKSWGMKAGGQKGKSRSVLPSKDDQNCPVPIGLAQALFDLLDGDKDVGMEELRDMSTKQLWASLGLLGATQFPFAKQGSAGGAGPRPKWHQIVGLLAILKGGFTEDAADHWSDQPDHTMREQQEQQPDKSLLPPPFAVVTLTGVENGTPYFTGLEQIPNHLSLIMGLRTLASQWIQQLKAFTKLGSFHILHFSNDVKSQSAQYFSDLNSEYRKAMGPNN
ncbi:hypothetical protein FRC10_004273 [Ceratobasidium sp. 414]|nr:hypothetical protein FRC10_004273 [Ceratobasidium sp. 414]